MEDSSKRAERLSLAQQRKQKHKTDVLKALIEDALEDGDKKEAATLQVILNKERIRQAKQNLADLEVHYQGQKEALEREIAELKKPKEK